MLEIPLHASKPGTAQEARRGRQVAAAPPLLPTWREGPRDPWRDDRREADRPRWIWEGLSRAACTALTCQAAGGGWAGGRWRGERWEGRQGGRALAGVKALLPPYQQHSGMGLPPPRAMRHL